jgi:Zn finger protein HypA/HybF involved in hydrogenase expression
MEAEKRQKVKTEAGDTSAMVTLKCKKCRGGKLELTKEIKNEEMYVEILNETKRVNSRFYKCPKCGEEEHNMQILEI